MFTSTKTILKIFSQTALIRANNILRDSNSVNEVVNTASKEIDSEKKRIFSVQNDIKVLISMLKAWVSGDYKEVPWTTLVLTAGALIYFINPLDAVPDMIPAAGLIDDATVVGFVIASIKQDLAKFKSESISCSKDLVNSVA